MSPRRERALGVAGGRSVAELRPVPRLEAVPHNLPAELSSFVGRVPELAEIGEALSATRLLTLTGAGGCGKSRLAHRTATETLEAFLDGVWWVELAAVTDAGLVAPALVQTLGVRPLPGQSDLEAAISYLGSRRTLILLDNCEHLLDEAGRVVEALLRGCPTVTVLATSREPLGVSGETDWRVPSLTLPDQTDTQAGVEDSDAVRLFTERGAKVRPDFRVNDANAATVVRICRELDGMPLAIELAAARLRMLSVEQIAEGLGDRFRLLSGRTRSALPRHRTLRASVEWSHDLLAAPERRLFGRLGVFVGGFTLEAAERVGSGDGIGAAEVLDLLGSLVEKSLVQVEERGAAVRYRLLETVRQYALERLDEAGEIERTRDRHRDAYLALAESTEPGLLRARQHEVLDLLDPEAANLAQAIEWASHTETEKALRLCVALIFWWRLRGRFPQGEASLHQVLTVTEGESSLLRARALVGRAYLLTYGGLIDAAIPAAQEALAEAERVSDASTLALALVVVGTMTLFPDPVGSRPILERARELAAASGDEYAFMIATGTLAYSHSHQDDHRQARALLEEIRPLAERTQNQEILAFYWGGVAWAEVVAGALDACRAAAERAFAAARDVGDIVTEVGASAILAMVDMYRGEPQRALERLAAVRERALVHGGAFTLPWLEWSTAFAYAADGRLEDARSVSEALIERGAGGIASVLTSVHVGLAEVLRLLEDRDEAETVAHRGRELADRIGNRWLGAFANLVLGRLAAARREWGEAQRLHHEALSAIVEGGYLLELPRALAGLAEVAAGLESYIEAARILGAAARVRRDLGLVAWKHQRGEVASLEARLRDALGDKAFEQAFSEGEALSLDEAVAYVRRARGSRRRPSTGWESLTPTELEVVRHAAAGLPNPEIGERMFISRGTVKGHLANIYAKLGIRNRSELAAVAARRAGTSEG